MIMDNSYHCLLAFQQAIKHPKKLNNIKIMTIYVKKLAGFFSGRDYYQSIEHIRKYPETKYQVLSPAGTYPAGLSKIEN
jgi:hypothetical protein